MKKVLFIVGSLRKESFNRQLAEATALLIGNRAEVSFLDYKDVPFFSQDIEYPAPNEVERARREVMDADYIWFFSPEYNSSYPGVLKNLLDWLSRPLVPGDWSKGSAISKKRVTVSSAAGGAAGAGVKKNLSELLRVIRTDVVLDNQFGIKLSAEAFKSNKLTLTDEDIHKLKEQIESLLKG